MMFVNHYRSIILGFNIGMMVWLIVTMIILNRNYRATQSRKTLAILVLFIGWTLDVGWQIFLTVIRIMDHEPALLPLALIFKVLILIFIAAAVTNFMYVMYGSYIRLLLKRWLNE